MPESATTASAISGILHVAVTAVVVAGIPADTNHEIIGPVLFGSGSEPNNTGSAAKAQDPLRSTEITELLEEDAEDFALLQPIPVEFRYAAAGNLEAYVPGTDLAFTGVNRQDAKEHLQDWIVGLFEDLADEDPAVLGPRPARQIEALRRYLRRA